MVSDEHLINQLAAEIGAQDPQKLIEKSKGKIGIISEPRPRKFYLATPSLDNHLHSLQSDEFVLDTNTNTNQTKKITYTTTNNYSEHDLYPILMDFLHKDRNLKCLRINEKKSKNSYGSGGNRWLHPDIVALEPLSEKFETSVKDCIRNSNQTPMRLWSFEVKKQLTLGNLRESFFQTVSNSSWANFGYLVATKFDKEVETELQMLSSLHGIGFILLNVNEPCRSEILIPAKEKFNIDWQSVNRIVKENSDFNVFLKQVNDYNLTGTIINQI